jgi:predicted nucleotidyltransferase
MPVVQDALVCLGHGVEGNVDQEDVLAILRGFMRERAQDYALISIGVFGSVARGEDKDDSDVDIVFETSAPNLFRTASMQVELERLLSRRVDVVRLREGMNPRLRQRILHEARYV